MFENPRVGYRLGIRYFGTSLVDGHTQLILCDDQKVFLWDVDERFYTNKMSAGGKRTFSSETEATPSRRHAITM